MAQYNNSRPQGNVSNVQKHTWEIAEVTKKELNANQWPFKIVKNKGQSSRMDIRSITDLKKSFEGTPYNFIDCNKIDSRYTKLLKKFKTYAEITPDITHLLITFDSVYFQVQRKSATDGNIIKEIRGFRFVDDLIKPDEFNSLVCGVLLNGGYLENTVKENFLMYNNMVKQGEKIPDTNLRSAVQNYINNRKKVKALDNTKPLIDILKSELNFTSLQYLYFIPYPSNSKDYQSLVKDWFNSNNIAVSAYPLMNEMRGKLPNLQWEKQGLSDFINGLRNGEYYRSLRKVFIFSYNEQLTPETISSFFESANTDKINAVYVSEAEKVRKEQEDKKLEKANAEHNEKLNAEKTDIANSYLLISMMIASMNGILRKNEEVHAQGKAVNNAEYGIWIKEYEKSKVANRILAVYDYRKKEFHRTDIKEVYPITKILLALQNNAEFTNNKLTEEDIHYFASYVPTYFKDDRSSLKSLGCEDFNSVEDLKKLNKILVDIKEDIRKLFEVFLGVQYGTFGAFMMRYGYGGMKITKVLITDFINSYRNKSFNITPNVKEYANDSFYLVNTGNTELVGEKAGYDENDDIENKLRNFVMTYLKEISGSEVNTLVHSNSTNSAVYKFANLFDVLSSVNDIVENTKSLVHLDSHSEDNIKNMIAEIQSNV